MKTQRKMIIRMECAFIQCFRAQYKGAGQIGEAAGTADCRLRLKQTGIGTGGGIGGG